MQQNKLINHLKTKLSLLSNENQSLKEVNKKLEDTINKINKTEKPMYVDKRVVSHSTCPRQSNLDIDISRTPEIKRPLQQYSNNDMRNFKNIEKQSSEQRGGGNKGSGKNCQYQLEHKVDNLNVKTAYTNQIHLQEISSSMKKYKKDEDINNQLMSDKSFKELSTINTLNSSSSFSNSNNNSMINNQMNFQTPLNISKGNNNYYKNKEFNVLPNYMNKENLQIQMNTHQNTNPQNKNNQNNNNNNNKRRPENLDSDMNSNNKLIYADYEDRRKKFKYN